MGTHAGLPRRTLAQSGSNGSRKGSSSDRSRRSGSWAVAVTAGGTSHDGVRDGGQHIQKKGVHVGEVPVSATRYACACALHLHRKVQGAGTRGPESRHGHLRGQRGGGGRGAGGWTGLGPCNGRPRDHRVRKRGAAAWHTLASPRSWPVPRTGRRRHWCCASTRTGTPAHTGAGTAQAQGAGAKSETARRSHSHRHHHNNYSFPDVIFTTPVGGVAGGVRGVRTTRPGGQPVASKRHGRDLAQGPTRQRHRLRLGAFGPRGAATAVTHRGRVQLRYSHSAQGQGQGRGARVGWVDGTGRARHRAPPGTRCGHSPHTGDTGTIRLVVRSQPTGWQRLQSWRRERGSCERGSGGCGREVGGGGGGAIKAAGE
jgi:hypothetical protein